MYHRSMSYRTQTVNKRRKLFKLHAKHQEEQKYKKNMKLVEAWASMGQKKHSEHNYSKSNIYSEKSIKKCTGGTQTSSLPHGNCDLVRPISTMRAIRCTLSFLGPYNGQFILIRPYP